MEPIDKQKPFTADELDRHEKQLEDWPDAQPKYETLERYIHQIRVQQEEIAKKQKYIDELQLRNADLAGLNVDLRQKAIQAEQERDELQESLFYEKRAVEEWAEKAGTYSAQKDALLGGLKWYAEKSRHAPFSSEMREDCGARARSLIAKIEGAPEKKETCDCIDTCKYWNWGQSCKARKEGAVIAKIEDRSGSGGIGDGEAKIVRKR